MGKKLLKITAAPLAKAPALLPALLLALLAGCDGNGPANVDTGKFVAVTDISGVARETFAGEDLILSGTVVPNNATNKTITWTVKNAGATGAAISGNTLSSATAGTVTVTAKIVKGKSSTSDFTKDFSIEVKPINALEASFDVLTNGGADTNLIMGNSLAWIKDAKEGSELVFYMSSTVYPDGAVNAQGVPFRPQVGDTIAVIGNALENSVDVKVPAGTTPGSGRSVRVAIPLEQALELIGNASSLKVDVKYGSINACQLMEPRRYKVPHSPNAQRMMNYFRDIYGEKMISGQMDISWEDSAASNDQIPQVFNATGKYPALKGFDHIQHRSSSGSTDVTPTIRQQAEEALRWWNGYDRQNREWVQLFPDRDDIHGIVCYCWHWRGTDGGYYGNDSDTPKTTLKVPMENGKLNKAHANFAYIKQEMDRAIAEFKWINEQGGGDVPIIWRPLHEAGGNWGRNPWFWWGHATDSSPGSGAFKALWEYMYDYMTIVNGLDNLIWLCNPQGDEMNNWVPDLKTFDLTGYDPYVGDHNSQKLYYDGCKNMDPTGNTMVTMSENGRIPDPDLCVQDNALWLFFMIWDRMFTSQNGSGEGSAAHRFYNHQRVVTLDTLPDLTKYRLE